MAGAANTSTNAQIVRKTERQKVPPNTSVAKKLEEDSIYNVLNKYRSYNYVFTLSSIPKQSSINDYINGKPLDNIVLKSSGKAVNGQSPDFQLLNDYGPNTELAKEELNIFNKNSPGKYDFYVNNFEMETIPIPTSRSGNTLPTKIRFDVFEPYSVVGFFEALRASALAGGFLNYLDASFLLKLEFYGYIDNEDLPEPKLIPKSTRYLKIKFTNIDVDVGVNGTVYKCSAIPYNDLAFANIYGSLKYSLQMSGDTVEEILKDMIKKLNENNLAEARKRSPEIKETEIDKYEIFFPTITLVDDLIITEKGSTNDIAKAKVRELSADNIVYKFENISDTNKRTAYQQTDNPKEFISYEPSKITVNFAHSAFIHEIISSVIRDSTYWTDQCDPETGKISEEFFNFWRIKSDIKYGGYSTFLRREVFTITYEVVPDEVHASLLPPNQAKQYSPEFVNILREYNYIYTGQNIDVLDVKINFNKLFYERLPVSLGNNDRLTQQNSDKPGGTNDVVSKTNSTVQAAANSVGGIPQYSDSPMPDIPKEGAGNAGAPSTNIKSYLAKDYYDILLSDSISMIEVDLQIIGDPVWLTSEIRSVFEKSFSNFIKLYFRNPVDVDETDIKEGGTGILKFSNKNIQFSGVYLVKNVVSTFRDGTFRQTLKLLRLPFVIDENDYRPEEVNAQNIYKTVPKPGDQAVAPSGQSVPQDKRSSLRSLVSGINNFADSIQNAEARIVGSIQGFVGEVSSAASQIVAVPAKAIAEATNSIQGKLQEINDVAVGAANTLGLTPSQLSSLSAKELLTVIALSKIVPKNVDMAQLEENGVIVPDANALVKIPAIENKDVQTGISKVTAETQQKIYQVTIEEL